MVSSACTTQLALLPAIHLHYVKQLVPTSRNYVTVTTTFEALTSLSCTFYVLIPLLLLVIHQSWSTLTTAHQKWYHLKVVINDTDKNDSAVYMYVVKLIALPTLPVLWFGVLQDSNKLPNKKCWRRFNNSCTENNMTGQSTTHPSGHLAALPRTPTCHHWLYETVEAVAVCANDVNELKM